MRLESEASRQPRRGLAQQLAHPAGFDHEDREQPDPTGEQPHRLGLADEGREPEYEHGADERARDRADAADDGDGDDPQRLAGDEVLGPELRLESGEQSARERGDATRDRERGELRSNRRDRHRFGRAFVLADGEDAAPDPGRPDPARDEYDDSEDGNDELEERALRREVERSPGAARNDRHGALTEEPLV